MIDTLFVYYTHKPGGLCHRLYRAMRACAERGDRVAYVTLDRPPESELRGVQVILIPFPITSRRGIFFWGVFTMWLPLYLFFACYRLRPTRIVTFGAYYANAAQLGARATGARLLLFLRSLTFRIDEITGKPKWLRVITGAVDKFGIRAASVVVTMGKEMQHQAQVFSGRVLHDHPILSNDLPHVAPRVGKPEDFCTATVGVLDARKNIEVLLQAYSQLALGGDAIRLLVIGDGPSRMKLEERAQALGLRSIVFKGWVPNALVQIKDSSLLLHPSAHEGVSNAVLEALACGVPVFASDIPEHRELFHAPDGAEFLISLDRPDQWAERIRQFVQDGEFRSRVEAQCAAIAELLRFDWDEELFSITRFD